MGMMRRKLGFTMLALLTLLAVVVAGCGTKDQGEARRQALPKRPEKHWMILKNEASSS